VITHELIQGSPAWHAHRATHFNASDAPAMMGVSPYKTRSELLRELATGTVPEVGPDLQKRYDEGHRTEALARPLAEEIVGEDLYPVVGSLGKRSASFDGLTMLGAIASEHKSLNDELRAVMVEGCAGADLPALYRVQMEQQCMVSGATRVLFMASKWQGNKLVEERHCWYEPDLELRAQIEAGWSQFERDLAAYVPPAHFEPLPVGKAPQSLPALRIQVTGAVTASNLAEFKQTALAAIRGVNRELKTDADFADAAESVKWCGDVESRLAAAKEHALSQTASIDELFKTIDDISAEARSVRLELDKLVTRRKGEIKDAIVLKARQAYDAHVASLKAEAEGIWYALTQPDFAGAAKNKRTVASLQDAVDTALATGKIDADAMARTIRTAMACLKADSAGFEFLFADKHALLQKPMDDLKLAIKTRIEAHKAAEAEKERMRQAVVRPAPSPAPAIAPPTVRQTVAAGRPAVDNRPPMTTGALCDRLGFTVTAAFVSELGIAPAPGPEGAKGRAGTYWREADFAAICDALVLHLQRLTEQVEA
jgi:putative phage-type endonuclease